MRHFKDPNAPRVPIIEHSDVRRMLLEMKATVEGMRTLCIKLALHADLENIQGDDFTVPAIIFDRLPEDHIVQMFVTINAKHTRLNASHLVSLSGRQLYRDELTFGGNRSILLEADQPLPKAALRHCIALALTYHRNAAKDYL